MRTGRKSLTKEVVHSYVRTDYTREELDYDRTLCRKAKKSLVAGYSSVVLRSAAGGRVVASSVVESSAVAWSLSSELWNKVNRKKKRQSTTTRRTKCERSHSCCDSFSLLFRFLASAIVHFLVFEGTACARLCLKFFLHVMPI